MLLEERLSLINAKHHGSCCSQHRKYGNYQYRRYMCSGALNTVAPANRCHNKGWMDDKVETMVWQEIERVLTHPELIVAEIDNQRQATNHTNHIETELK